MIIPKQQMKIEQTQGQYLKKQALQLIIELYMTRSKHQDISFLHSNFHSSGQFALGIGSSLKNGLTPVGIDNNRVLYGENQKIPPSKCITFKQCIIRQLYNPFFVVGVLFLLSCIIYSQIKCQLQLASSAEIILIFQSIASLTRILQAYYYSKRLQKSSYQKTKNNMYQVIRNGHLLQIQESDIVVGDVIQLGFKQKVPATGIIISSKPIFVKQDKNNPKNTIKNLQQQQQAPPQLKMNLQSCIRKIQNMDILDLKISIQKSSLPSPIVLRGSQLLKGNTYTLMIIAVNEETLLKKYGYNKQDKFQNKNYNQWANKLTNKWKTWGIVLIIIVIIILPLSRISQIQLDRQKKQRQVEIFFNKFLQIGVLILILNENPIKYYLDTMFVKLMIDIKVIDNYSSFFTLERIICNERNVIDEDKIQVQQIAVCQKMDLLGLQQIINLNENTVKVINKVDNIFKLNIQQTIIPIIKQKQNHKQVQIIKQQQKINRIIHVLRKNYKIISYLYTPELTTQKRIDKNLNICKQLNKNTQNRQKIRSSALIQSSIQQKQNKGSHNMLKLPKILTQLSDQRQQNNLKQLIHTKGRMRSINFLDGLVSLAEKGLRTYYYQLYDLKGLDQINTVIINGKIAQFNLQYKQRMGMLARKIKVVYNLTPILLGFNEGPYNEKPFKTLICIIGIKINNKNQIIQKLKQLQQQGIKSLIFTVPSPNSTISVDNNTQYKLQQNQQKQMLEQYINRGWLCKQQSDKIYNMDKLKKQMKRLVCKYCWISNCDCKDKIQQVTNIQPFIQIQNNIKIIYNINQQGIKYLQSAYKQLQSTSISINSTNLSALDIIQSVFVCLYFVRKMVASVIVFYVVGLVYFCCGVVCWTGNEQYVSGMQIGMQYVYMSMFLIIIFLLQTKIYTNNSTNTTYSQSQADNKNKIKIITTPKTIIYYIISILIIICSILINRFHYRIPQYYDDFDMVMQQYQLDVYKCKYTRDDGYVVGSVVFQGCLYHRVGYQSTNLTQKYIYQNNQSMMDGYVVQYSRISTIITYYLFVTLWLLMVLTHRNFKSIISIMIYIIALFVYTFALQMIPYVMHTYSEGLAWQHYLIVITIGVCTILVGYIIGHFVHKFPIFKYFNQQTQSIVNFNQTKRTNKDGYTAKLKKYWMSRKWQILDQSDGQKVSGLFCKERQ